MRPKLADQQLTELAAGPTPADLVEGFAVPFTVRVICRVLGLPSSDIHLFKPWVDQMMSVGRFPQKQVDECHQRFHGYVAGLVDTARAAIDRGEAVPGLLGDLLAPRNPRRRLSRDDVVVLSAGLLIAGYETTSNVLATVVFHLLRRPELMAQVREGPARADDVLEELLRFMCANGTGGMPHVATADVPLAGGVVVPEGETVVPVPDAANRDPAVFDEPARVRTDRRPNPHVAFGHGPHYCLGAELARLELRVGVSALVSRFPALRIAVGDDELRWRTDMFVRGLWRLPVTW